MSRIPRVVSLASLAIACVAAPLTAQSVATVYLRDGGTLRGQIIDDTDPGGVKLKSEKSGTVFMLKRSWIDSIVKPTVAVAKPVPAPAPAAAAPKPAPAMVDALEPPQKKAEVKQAEVKKAEVKKAEVKNAEVKQPEVKRAEKAEKAEKAEAPASYTPSKWYIGGGGAAYTGSVAQAADIGYGGMIGYGSGLGRALAVRLGASGSYWRVGQNAGDFYDLAGNIDLIIGPRSPRFLSPYAVLGGLGGVRSSSSLQVGVSGYTRDPLYGARAGIGVSAKRVFAEVSYQHVWVDGVASGYVPFVLGLRF